tara:strand:+ start:172 stop:603 length:432 start_codon:yes stop_codon:yes gene_type:complete
MNTETPCAPCNGSGTIIVNEGFPPPARFEIECGRCAGAGTDNTVTTPASKHTDEITHNLERKTYTLSRIFIDSHCGRDLAPYSIIVATMKRLYRVELTQEQALELLSDAEHYADGMYPESWDTDLVRTSNAAKTVARKLAGVR